MSQFDVIAGPDSTPVYPLVRKIGPRTSKTLWPKASMISWRCRHPTFS